MKGFVQNIEGLAIDNIEFRRVLYTAKSCQLVLMALLPKEEIGAEVHELDPFFRVEEGTGEAVLDGVRTQIRAGFAVQVASCKRQTRFPAPLRTKEDRSPGVEAYVDAMKMDGKSAKTVNGADLKITTAGGLTLNGTSPWPGARSIARTESFTSSTPS